MLKSRLHPDALALAALALLALVFWGNCLWGGKVPVAALYQKQMLPWAAVSPAGGETRQWDSLLWDSMAQFYPWRLLLHNAARQGELPLWNPYQFCGYPFVGNGQSAMFYPPNWLYFAIHPKIGMGLSAALHFFLGGVFVFGLARRWGLSLLPAVFSSVAFTYGGFMVTWIELPTLVNSLIWLPLAWWGIEELIARGKFATCPVVESAHHRLTPDLEASGKLAPRGLFMLATAFGMTLLAGHFQIAAYVWIFTALYALLRLLSLATIGGAIAARRMLLTGAVAVILGAALSLTQVLPTLELGRYSSRGAGKPSAAGFRFHKDRALQPIELTTLLQADFLGTPVDGSYKGISYSEHCPYVGAMTIALGLLGLFLGWRRKQVWLFFGIAVFALWGAMGGPPAMLLYWGVPKLGQAGGFSRLLSVWTLAAALWGGAGLQVLLERLGASSSVGRGLVLRRGLRSSVLRTQEEEPGASPALKCGAEGPLAERPADANGDDADGDGVDDNSSHASAIDGNPSYVSLADDVSSLEEADCVRGVASEGRSATLFVAPQPGTSVPGNAIPSLSSPSGVRRTLNGNAAATVVGVLALVLLLLEMLPWAYRFNPRADAKDVYPATQFITQLRERLGSARYLARNDRRAWGLATVPAGVILPPNAATVYGLRCVDGYDSLFPLSYRQFAARTEKADPSPLANGNMLLLSDSSRWLVSLIATAQTLPPSGRRLRLLWAAEGCALYTDLATPRTDRGILCLDPLSSAVHTDSPITVEDTSLNALRVSFPPLTRSGAMLYMQDTYYPGWSFWSGGQERRGSADGTHRMLPLQASDSSVAMVYYPASVACGLFLSLLALAALVALGTMRWGGRVQ